ncbi:MAG: retropepsin-like aspartic protease [Ginsengibacter sp.]
MSKNINTLSQFLFSAILLTIFFACNQKNSSKVFSQLDSLVQHKEFFKLESQFQKEKDQLDKRQQLYFNAFLNNAFNKNSIAVKQVDSIIENYPKLFQDSVKSMLLQIQEDSYFKLFQYAKAAETDSILIHDYASVLDSSDLADRKNKFLLTNALRHTPPQYISKDLVTEIRWKRNPLGLITIPVKHDTSTFNAIFDTRANISSITQSFAKKLDLKILPVNYTESSGATGMEFKTGLGIADSLVIGNILIRNAVFQVMPDSVLYIAPLKTSLDLILGFPVIAALGEIHIVKDGQMIIPKIQNESALHNLSLHELDPVVLLKTGNDTLAFNFDLGASTTDLYSAFYQKYKSKIIKEGFQKKIHVAGAGGILEKTVYIIPSLPLTLGDKTKTIDSVDVFMQKVFPKEILFGNIGNDFASQFTDLVLNFDKMYIKGN